MVQDTGLARVVWEVSIEVWARLCAFLKKKAKLDCDDDHISLQNLRSLTLVLCYWIFLFFLQTYDQFVRNDETFHWGISLNVKIKLVMI